MTRILVYPVEKYLQLNLSDLKKRFEDNKFLIENYISRYNLIRRVRTDPEYADKEESELKQMLEELKQNALNIVDAMKVKGI